MQMLDERIETFAAQNLTLAKVSRTGMPGFRVVLVMSGLLSNKSYLLLISVVSSTSAYCV